MSEPSISNTLRRKAYDNIKVSLQSHATQLPALPEKKDHKNPDMSDRLMSC